MVSKIKDKCVRCSGFVTIDRYEETKLCLNCGWRDVEVNSADIFHYMLNGTLKYLDPAVKADRLIMKRFLSMCPGSHSFVYRSKNNKDASGRIRYSGECKTCCKIVSSTQEGRSHKHTPPASLQNKIWEHLNWSIPLSKLL